MAYLALIGYLYSMGGGYYRPEDGPLGCTMLNSTAANWTYAQNYSTNDMVTFDGRLYKCQQDHQSGGDLVPPLAPVLWQTPTPCGISPWREQTLYKFGSMVTFNGSTYNCMNAHISEYGWPPSENPGCWEPLGLWVQDRGCFRFYEHYDDSFYDWIEVPVKGTGPSNENESMLIDYNQMLLKPHPDPDASSEARQDRVAHLSLSLRPSDEDVGHMPDPTFSYIAAINADGSGTVSIDWDAKHAQLNFSETMLSGWIDGREFKIDLQRLRCQAAWTLKGAKLKVFSYAWRLVTQLGGVYEQLFPPRWIDAIRPKLEF